MTVQELIDALNKYDKDKIVAIEDADTNWYLHVMTIMNDKNYIVISGNYMNEVENE